MRRRTHTAPFFVPSRRLVITGRSRGRSSYIAVTALCILLFFWYDTFATRAVLWADRAITASHGIQTDPSAKLPEVIAGLLIAPPMANFHAPALLQPPSVAGDNTYIPSDPTPPPALLRLHVFSTATQKGRARRDLVRRLSPLRAVPRGYRHLVELRFVVPMPHGWSQDAITWRRDLTMEDMQYGDLAFLPDLGSSGRTAGQVKSVQWLQWAGSGREALWVVKCGDDTLPVLPNLLPALLSHNPDVPTYIGSSHGRNLMNHMYFVGALYGFSWPVAKTFTAANISTRTVVRDLPEDARMGEVLFSLPPKSGDTLLAKHPCLSYGCSSLYRGEVLSPELFSWAATKQGRADYPRAPDPQTGLHYVNLLSRVQDWLAPHWLAASWRPVVAWYRLHTSHGYEAAYRRVEAGFVRERGEYKWRVPRGLRVLYDPDEVDVFAEV